MLQHNKEAHMGAILNLALLLLIMRGGKKSRRNVAVGHALVSPTGKRCAMMAESSTGSKKFLSCFSLCFLVFRNFVAEWNTYPVLL